MAAAQLQALLRFLSQDAKVPLALAMGKAKELQKANLKSLHGLLKQILIQATTSAEDLSKSDLKQLQDIFLDEKVAKQVLNAAKRVSKKRSAPSDGTNASTSSSIPSETKKARKGSSIHTGQPTTSLTSYEIESSLALPGEKASEDELLKTVILTNRAPLVLAFAVCVLKYTMPEQPISSRLSLAQTVVSANSRSKAVSIGLESGKSAEEEGWGQGQPTIRVLGRQIPVLKRWHYDPDEGRPAGAHLAAEAESDRRPEATSKSDMPPLWGLDLEAWRKSTESQNSSKQAGGRSITTGLPIHTPEAARSYLLKSFMLAKDSETDASQTTSSSKKTTKAPISAEKENCLAMLLQAIDMLCDSWASTLSTDDLDRRAWSWYLHVRPDVRSGVAGWGEKGQVRLADLLALRREA